MLIKNVVLATFSLAFVFANCKERHAQQITPSYSNTIAVTTADTTGQLMNEDAFWAIIAESRKASNNKYRRQIESLKGILAKLEPVEIVKFNNRFTALLMISYDSKLWGAAYVINGGCSDDCFDYFRQFLIGHGKEKFYQTLKDPDNCGDWIRSETEVDWEGLQYSAGDAYKLRTGRTIPITYAPKFELKGKLFDEESVNKQYPKLAKKFSGKN